MQKLKAVILVGGPGTRLQPLTDDRPKSIVPVCNRPVLEHTLAYLKQYGVKDIILTLSYLPDVIKDFFGDGSRFGVRLTYCIEVEPRGTAGAVKNAEAYLDGSFFVLNGDVFTNMNLNDLLAYHRRKKARATIALTWVDKPSAFGVVETDADGRVKRFIEKPPPGEETTNWINAGTYILEPEVLNDIPPDCHHMFEKGLFPRLLEINSPVYGYTYKGYWLDMGTPEKYFSVNMDMLNKKVNSPLIKETGNKGIFRGKDVDIHPSAEIEGAVMFDSGCNIGKGAKILGPVIIGRDCHLNDGAKVENTILWDGVNVGANARLSGSVVSSNICIGDNQAILNSVITKAKTAPLKLSEPK